VERQSAPLKDFSFAFSFFVWLERIALRGRQQKMRTMERKRTIEEKQRDNKKRQQNEGVGKEKKKNQNQK
jgi:hypothetical protein